MLHAISYECSNYLNAQYGIPNGNFLIVENWLPDEFARTLNRKCYGTIPKKIAVVSNHPPQEIKSLAKICKNNHIHISFFGEKKKILLITPEILLNYDVVITIGKTVQYCLGLGIPVYNYDHFGGNGYITTKNFEREKYFNFSGRPDCRRLNSYQIYHEIVSLYLQTLQNTEKLKNLAIHSFLLSKNVDKILFRLNKMSDLDNTNIKCFKLYNAQCHEICRRLSIERNKIAKHKMRNLFTRVYRFLSTIV